jgi:NACHT domain
VSCMFLSNLKAGRDILISNVKVNFSLFGQRSPSLEINWDGVVRKLTAEHREIRQRRSDVQLDVLADVHMTDEPQWVDRYPLGAIRKLERSETSQEEVIGPEQSLLEIFDRADVKGQLLILGAPGAGKTTALLELAEALVDQALDNPKTMIPMIFELSNWRDERQSIKDWLLQQLYNKYKVNPNSGIFEPWIEQRRLLPLLDGLDELGFERQKLCTQRINEFVTPEQQVVVCCRVKEFELAHISLANLSWAVQLQPLTDRQIEAYLTHVGNPELWVQIHQNQEMRQLLDPVKALQYPEHDEPGLFRVPLFISWAAQVFEDGRPLKGKADLLQQYVDKKLKIDAKRPDRQRKQIKNYQRPFKSNEREINQQEVQYLHWIALYMQKRGDVEFLIEEIDSSWLDHIAVEWEYQILVGLICGMTAGVISGLDFNLRGGIISGSIASLLVVTAKYCHTSLHPIQTFKERENENKKHLLSVIHRWLKNTTCGLLGATIIIGLFFPSHISLMKELMSVVGCGLFTSYYFIREINFKFFRMQHEITHTPNQRIWTLFYQAFWTGLVVFGMASAIILMLPPSMHLEQGHLSKSFIKLVSFSFGCSLFNGGYTVIQYLTLRIILTRHHKIPWNLAQFLTYCHERRLLQQIGGRYRFIHRELLDHFAGKAEG